MKPNRVRLERRRVERGTAEPRPGTGAATFMEVGPPAVDAQTPTPAVADHAQLLSGANAAAVDKLKRLDRGADEQAERVLVPRAGAGERTLGHDRLLAWPVPFALLTGSDQSARRKSPVPSGPRWCLKHKPRPNETSIKEDMPQ
jgi:hypothetical protein